MRSHVAAFGEALCAISALIGFLTGMPPNVDLEGARAHESLLAVLAHEGPVARVSPTVVSQVPLGREGLEAIWVLALEGFLPRVNAHVGFQVPALCESLAAASNRANEGFLSRLSEDEDKCGLTWVRMWMLRRFLREYCLRQMRHMKGLSPE